MAAPSAIADGTLAATGAEDTVATVNVPRNCVFRTSLTNLAVGDTVVLRVYVKVLSGGAAEKLYEETIGGPQGTPVYDSPPVASPHQAVFTIHQIAGTNRSFPWSVLQV